ncbi:MAG TPA: N-6 DNA methylase, partial [Blastocatellia bacterium]|nr:N-6 DNA methylase [Blastocatellia bacterium]
MPIRDQANSTLAGKERADRHRYGQHYTPAQVARLLAEFAVRRSSDLVLDPSCGDGRLLDATLQTLLDLSQSASPADLWGTEPCAQVFGLDRSADAVRLAAKTGARVASADFFDAEPGARVGARVRLPVEFDAVIGNPPYIRQEVMGLDDKHRVRRCLATDARNAPEIAWPAWSRRSDIYVYFFAHSTRFLKDHGRLVFLTASSWLDADYGRALKEFLLANYRVLAVIESSCESFFCGASINTAVTVLERETEPRARAASLVKFVRLVRPLSEVMSRGDFARTIENARSSSTAEGYRIRAVRQSELGRLIQTDALSGWGKYLRADDVFFDVLDRGGDGLSSLSEIARVRFGVKTGANDFFYVKQQPDERASLLNLSEVASVRRGITTGANEFFYLKAVTPHRKESGPNGSRLVRVENRSGERHLIESRYLRPVIFSLREVAGIRLEKAPGNRLFFYCPSPMAELDGQDALRYIKRGESAGYHLRPTCAARRPWYAVARGMKPAPLIFPSKVGERWVIAINRARAFEDKKLYGIFPRPRVSTALLAALLNSTWARYYAEVTARQMTGAQAIADIDVAVAEHILLPDPRRLSASLK